MTLTFAELQPVLPELFLACAGMVLLVLGALKGNAATPFIGKAVLISFVIALLILLGVQWDGASLFNNMLVIDQFSGFLKLLVLLGLMATVALSFQYLEQIFCQRFEYYILILFSGIGMMLMLSANDLLSLYVGLELQSLSLYVLASIRRDHLRSAEAGMKYFILGAISSGMLLFGASILYGFTGTTNFEGIADVLASGLTPGALVGMVFVLAGLAFKVSAVPFHMWTPDVYEGAPTSVTAFFALVPKLAALGLIARFVFIAMPAAQDQVMQILWLLSAASMTLGAFAGLAQENIKRLLAYSSIGNMGYAMIGIIAGTQEGVGAMIFYMTIYMIMTAGTFGLVLCMRRNGTGAERIEDLAGLSQNNPYMAYALAILMFSMSGIPPLAGFFGKLIIFQAAVQSGFYVLAVLGVLTSVVAAYYYLRLIKTMFFDEPADKFDRQASFSRRSVVMISVLFILFFIFKPSVLVDITVQAAGALFAG